MPPKSHPFTLLLGLFLAMVAGWACAGDDSDPLFCDEQKPCADPSRSFCDTRGIFPESGGVENHCIARPHAEACSDAEPCPEGDRPHCNFEGTCSECLNYSHCTREAPKCNLSTNECGPCDLGETGDELCAVFDPLQPYCGPDGSCVACVESSQCEVVSAPVCDPVTYNCRGCQSGDECPSGVCDDVTGICEAPA